MKLEIGVNIFLLLLVLMWSLTLVYAQKDVVQLSNTSPAIAGSNILFKAVVYDGTSHPVQDEKYFVYNWFNPLDGYKATHGYQNTTLKKCYDQFTRPDRFKMTVHVYDMREEEKDRYIGTAHSHFEITDKLNGNLNISQKLKYREPDMPKVYSTREPIILRLNLTDRFKVAPSMEYSWFLDGESFVQTDNPETFIPYIPKTGEHKVKVEAKVVSTVPDCKGFSYTGELKGHFDERIILKDPVGVNVSGKTNLSTVEPIIINVTLNGSDPFKVCWSAIQIIGMQCIGMWCCHQLTNVTEYNITIWNQTEGNYAFNISVTNDVSSVYNEHHVNVYKEPPPQPSSDPSAAAIILPVIGGLLAVCFLLAVTIYVMKMKKKKYVEVADFDFHPTISVTERRQTIVSNIKYTLQRLFDRNNYEENHRHARPPHSRSYGSIETSQKEPLFQTL